jgi:hypothetical protein
LWFNWYYTIIIIHILIWINITHCFILFLNLIFWIQNQI